MLPSFARESVTVSHPGTKTVRGVTVPDWTKATETTVTGCSVQPASTSRNFASARVLNIQDAFTLYAPPNAAIQPGDRVECSHGTFEVDGYPEPWTSPTGRVSHVQFTLRRWEG